MDYGDSKEYSGQKIAGTLHGQNQVEKKIHVKAEKLYFLQI